jgi:hypothetical protein
VSLFLFFELPLILGEEERLESILSFFDALGGRVDGVVYSRVMLKVLALA